MKPANPAGVEASRHRTGARKPIMSAGPTAAVAARSSYHVRRTAPSLHDDLYGVFVPRPPDRPGPIGGPLPLASVWVSRLLPVSGIEIGGRG